MRASAVSKNDLSTESVAVFVDVPAVCDDFYDDVLLFAWVLLELFVLCVVDDDALDDVVAFALEAVVMLVVLRYELVAMM